MAQLARLDDELRQDVPGAGGWENDLAELAERTFDPRLFDPETYLVAVGDRAGELAGLVRIWRASRVPRLGLVAVRRPYRRRGLATALLHAAFRPLAARGGSGGPARRCSRDRCRKNVDGAAPSS